MKRAEFLKKLVASSLSVPFMRLQSFSNIANSFPKTAKMPVLFLGHGNPMNAIEENDFVKRWRSVGKAIGKPNAIICISAHWETKGTFVTAMDRPKTIHDFSGFPQELFNVQYPALGDHRLAREAQRLVSSTDMSLDYNWGLDHGCWSVLKHLYPKADVPIIQISLDYTKSLKFHYEMAKELLALRTRGVLIVGSGNIVHNLSKLSWSQSSNGYDWAIEANEGIKKMIVENELIKLFKIREQGSFYSMSIPTVEHYLPLLYVLGLKTKGEKISFFNDQVVLGSISMTSLIISKE